MTRECVCLTTLRRPVSQLNSGTSRRMRLPPARLALFVCLGASILSCSDSPTSLRQLRPGGLSAVSTPAPTLRVSQVYGGGGNSGAARENDLIEIFNPGRQKGSTKGWSV